MSLFCYKFILLE